MANATSNFRKAAVLIGSLDSASAAELLAQLSPPEAGRIREAIRTLGPIDPDEQADVLAEYRRVRPLANEPAPRGVELSLSQPTADRNAQSQVAEHPSRGAGSRFDFLENAPTSVLVGHLSREHAQTIAVLLSHLAPRHAAEVLAALPEKRQAETIERLSVLRETDSESIAVLESELAAWAANRIGGRSDRERHRDPVTAILDAADTKTRHAILDRLKTHNSSLADRFASKHLSTHSRTATPPGRSRQPRTRVEQRSAAPQAEPRSRPPAPALQPLPRIEFDHLIHFDDRALAAVLHEVDANALALALAGSSDELVDRICAQMPKRTAKSFRRELRRLGPTRLSDVEAAQRAVAQIAAQHLARRRVSQVA